MRQPQRETGIRSVVTDATGIILRWEGACADQIRTRDWSSTAIGDQALWDAGFITALTLLLDARFPMFLTWGPDHQIFYNDAYAPIVEYKGDCLGRSFKTVFPEAWPRVGRAFARALDGVSAFEEDWEVPLVRTEGAAKTSHWVCSYSPARDAAGVIRGVLGVVYETTDRLRTGLMLKKESATLRTVTDEAPILLWQSDDEGRVTWGNQPFRHYTGVATDGTIPFKTLLHCNDLAAAHLACARAAGAGRPVTGRFRLIGREGQCRTFLIGARRLSAPGGTEMGWCGSAVDVSEGARDAKDAESGEELLRAVASASSGLPWVLDRDAGMVQGLNPEFVSGWSLPANGAGVLWSEWLDALHPEDRPQVVAAVESVFQGATRQGRVRFRLGDVVRCFHAIAFPLAGERPRIGGYLVDITEEPTTRLYVVDGDAGSRTRLTLIFSQAGFRVRAFADLETAKRMVQDLQPGVFVLAGADDVEAIERTAEALGLWGRRSPWIVIGDFTDIAGVVRLMRNGASHVSRADEPASALVQVARAAAPALLKAEREHLDAARRLAALTAREREVLEGLLAGGSNKSIAQTLGLSPRTVETYRSNLMDRLGARSLADLLRIAGADDRDGRAAARAG